MGLDHWLELRSTDHLTDVVECVRQWRKWHELHEFVEELWRSKDKEPQPLELKPDELKELLDAIRERNFDDAHALIRRVRKQDEHEHLQFNCVPFHLDADDWASVKKFILENQESDSEGDDGWVTENEEAIRNIDSQLEVNPKLRVYYNCSW